MFKNAENVVKLNKLIFIYSFFNAYSLSSDLTNNNWMMIISFKNIQLLPDS